EVVDWQFVINICQDVNEDMEVSKGDGKFVDTSKKEESVKRKEEAVKRNEEPVK
ncbi:hypothetical protein Tco_1500938, partial [Tanacetum coccineum]